MWITTQRAIHEMLFDWKKSSHFVFKTPQTSDSCQLESWSTISYFLWQNKLLETCERKRAWQENVLVFDWSG